MRSTLVISVLLFAFASAPGMARENHDCVKIENDAERLRCYDAVNGRAPAAHAERPVPSAPPAISSTAASRAGRSGREQRMIDDAHRDTFTLTSYRPTYFLYTHVDSPNKAPYRALGTAAGLRHSEVKLQLSFKTKIAEDMIAHNGDLWFAYTQTSFWQAGNDAISSPFRETNHAPAAYLSFLTDYPVLGLTARTVNVGFVHQSNGQSRPLSRSWNRLYADFQFVRGDFSLSVKPWVRIKESAEEDDNPDIEDFLGQYEVRAFYEHNDRLYSLMLRNVFDDRYNAELSWSFPIAGRLRGLVQLYSGYGENLIDYNHKQNRIGLGVLMSDWL